MTIYSAKTLRSLPLTTTLSLLLFLVCRSFAIDLTPPPPPPPPSVVVTTGDPGDPDPGDTASCGVSAGVDNPPDPGKEATLIPHWSWSVGTVTVHPYNGGSDVTADAGDFHVSLNPIHDPGKPDDGMIDDTNSAATFTGTFRLTGYYAVPLIATVTYFYKDSGKYYGTYSGSDFVGDSQDNPDYDPTQDTSGTSAAAPAMTPNFAAGQPQAPAGPPKPPLPKRVPSGLLAKLPNPVKLGLYSKNHATETYTITVLPKSLFGDVKFTVPSGVASVDPKPETTTNANGQIVNTGNLILTFKAINPSTNLSGEDIVAKRASTGKGVGEGTVLVLVPASIDKVSLPKTEVIGKNILANSGSSPAADGVPPPHVQLITNYGTTLVMQVRDQFHQPLDSIFAGTSVSEEIDGDSSYSNINSAMTSAGTYVDPVGVPQATSQIEDNSSTDAAKAWLSENKDNQPLLPPIGSRTVTISVNVGNVGTAGPHPTVQRKYTTTRSTSGVPYSVELTVEGL